jgi:HEAT repeat protein
MSINPSRLSFAAEIAGRQLPSEKVIPSLLKLARHEEPVVREGALYGLSFHLDDEVVRTTVQTIASSDTSEAVRSVADDLMDRITASTHGEKP